MSDESKKVLTPLTIQGDSELESELRKLGIPEAELPKVFAVIQTRISQHNYHLPDGSWIHPDAVQGIDALCPGFAKRYSDLLLERGRVALAHAEHEIAWEKNEQASQSALLKKGMQFGFVVSLVLIMGAIYCATIGATLIGSILVGAAALGMVGKFIDGAHRK
ncbi:hypothetical protein CU669_18400 [Paramagnetospirillum kuznetsovii]|uniref:DUF2335 domain-containing protein n=1 Tax=Paramagnetospirillum kuznetsovii TaxID=2053833 RepID=A0A364NU42_9PROT|nr:hypothetical protein [Paramagnetospirillum kuznetsovii]RAU20425.1 hypothetical protein CU669_18400 [Paramagnetospirillum kuznetsovii]